MIKLIVFWLFVQLVELIVVVILCDLIWRYALKPYLPKTWVKNCIMFGLPA